MLICPEASSAQNNMAAVSADGSTVWVLILRLNSSCSRSIAFVVRTLRHWLCGQTGEGEEPIAGFLQAVRDGSVLEPPLADEGFAALFDLFARCRIDHVVVVVRDLLMQALGRVGEKIPVLVHRASLHRHTIPNGGNRALKPCATVHDEELGPPQAALDEVIKHSAPSLGALAAHLFNRHEHFWAVGANPDDDEERDGSSFAIEPHSHHSAVENQPHDWLVGQRAGVPSVPVALHLAPDPAHSVLANLSAKYAANVRGARGAYWCRPNT